MKYIFFIFTGIPFLSIRYPIRSVATLINPSIRDRFGYSLIFNTAIEFRVVAVVIYFINDSHWNDFIEEVNEYLKSTGTLYFFTRFIYTHKYARGAGTLKEPESLKMQLEMGFYLQRRATLINPL